ncbi:MAG: LysM peptidoglycan-binding domain-containing protein [Bacteroidia bacterium]|nr:LysM peptidoglycan-binding domain-containing protein [Bacteroidia bacterium]
MKKYLAHKVAFEDAVKAPGQTQVITFENKSKRTLDDLAVEIAVEPVQLKALNKWALKGRIPDDKAYTVIVPATPASAAVVANKTPTFPSDMRTSKPRITGAPSAASAKDGRIKINGLIAIKARPSEDAKALAARGGIDLSLFLKANEMSISEPIRDGDVYFLQKKRNRATDAYYTTQAGETMWSISQKFGVKVSRLERYNRMREGENPKPGQVVWLASRKPRNDAGPSLPAEVLEVDGDKTFNWSAAPDADATAREEQEKPSKPETTMAQENQLDIGDSVEVQAPVALDTAGTVAAAHEPRQQAAEKDTVKIMPAVAADTVARIPLKVIPTEHQVKQGETLYGIARQYELEVMDLAKWNNLNLQQSIKPGQQLSLVNPEADKKEDTASKPREVIHEVKASDTLYSVARKYNVTIKELMDWNGKKDFNVSVGEKLRVMQQ